MASYFDEHDCQPLADGETPNHRLHLARLLRDVGLDLSQEFAALFGRDKAPPPTSKKFVADLEQLTHAAALQLGEKSQCPVCVQMFRIPTDPSEFDEVLLRLPCKHSFHADCIRPWLQRTSTCPVCRLELPTDDAEYEEFRKRKLREKQREEEIADLHGGMYT